MAKRRKFTSEFKTELVLEVLSGASSQAELCRRHNLNEDQLSKWKQQFLEQVKVDLSCQCEEEHFFHNPYTFVPTPPRSLSCMGAGDFAGDFNPLKHPLGEEHNLCHASLKKHLWTGRIPIKLTAVTPIVLLKNDGTERDSKEHQVYDVHDHIPEPSLRGILRSAYEVVTNSRYGCFDTNQSKQLRSLDKSLRPAENMDQLSPADRLFGWTPQGQQAHEAQQTHGGYKGRIRVICEEVVSANAARKDKEKPEIIKRFEGGDLPLTILSAPKPSYTRFYVAKDKQGTPQCDGIPEKQADYKDHKGLRGRKQYWHHRGLEIDPSKSEHDQEQAKAYWYPSVEDRTQIKQNNRYQEYRRPDKHRDNQNPNGWQQKTEHNCSIKGWMPPGTVFKASLYVQNLQSAEVGALLWLLSLNQKKCEADDKHYFRIGYGKPLGFGSVTMEIDEDRCLDGYLPLSTGKDLENYYASFDADMSSLAKLDQNQRSCCIQKFKTSMEQTYPDRGSFDELLFIEGFLQVLRGPKTDLPIHYPRLTCKPNPKGRNFDWFKANKKENQKNKVKEEKEGLKLSLPYVTEKKGLPYNPHKK